MTSAGVAASLRGGGNSRRTATATPATSVAAIAAASLTAASAALLAVATESGDILPGLSLESKNATAKFTAASRLHAVQRRQWETSQGVLGRQESASLRGPKASLNLSASGKTTPAQLRKEAGKSGPRGGFIAAGHDDEEDVSGDVESSPIDSAAAAVNAPSASAALWAARARVEDCLDLVLSLQEAARTLLATMRVRGGTAKIDTLRHKVASIRDALGAALGISDTEGSSAALLSLLSLPKGKKLLARAVPMLSAQGRAAACVAGMRFLPHFVASVSSEQDAQVTDEALAHALAGWVTAAAPLQVNNGGVKSVLSQMAEWVTTLHDKHTGVTIRALLAHPGGLAVLSALLSRGNAEHADVEAATNGVESTAEATNQTTSITAWVKATELLGSAYLDSATE